MATADGTSTPPKRAPRAQGHKPSHGDTTGRAKEALKAENIAELEEAAQRLTMVTTEQARSRREDVIDLSDPQRPVLSGTDIPADPQTREAEGGAIRTVVSPAGGQVVERVDPEARTERSITLADMSPAQREAYLSEKVPFQVNEDLEQVTLGKDNTMDLVAYQQYEGPRWMRDHFAEKGLLA